MTPTSEPRSDQQVSELVDFIRQAQDKALAQGALPSTNYGRLMLARLLLESGWRPPLGAKEADADATIAATRDVFDRLGRAMMRADEHWTASDWEDAADAALIGLRKALAL